MTAHKSTAASVLSRRALLLNGAAMAALAAFSPVTAAAQLDTAQRSAADAILRPFHIRVSEEALTDLRRRLAATRWPDQETVSDRSLPPKEIPRRLQ
jgi:microsomal epoxide hydrolase